jgi:hypothetical protein
MKYTRETPNQKKEKRRLKKVTKTIIGSHTLEKGIEGKGL